MEPDVILTQTIKGKLTDFLEHTDSSKQSKEIRDLIEKDAGIIPFRLIKYVFDRHQSKGTLGLYILISQRYVLLKVNEQTMEWNENDLMDLYELSSRYRQ